MVAGGGLNLDQEVESGALLTYYPLHEPSVLEELQSTWGNWNLAFKWCGAKPDRGRTGTKGLFADHWSMDDDADAMADGAVGGANCSSTHARSPLHQPLDQVSCNLIYQSLACITLTGCARPDP